MITAGQLLESKGRTVWSVAPDTSAFEAVRLMAEKGVGALLVLADGKLVGILSERDCARMILTEQPPRGVLVRDLMTERVVYIRAEQTLEECMALMTDKRVRHLPVFEGDRLIGVLSIGDLVKSIISEQKFIIKQMENYISGARG